ncbi:unnamed protein product, partial [Mesorhabditis belari]|uniref:Uncharacterized protein n=1 Tax=Mesorhabditis belari TaxID=2138241 RepID=A0AAF3FA10_9BILA
MRTYGQSLPTKRSHADECKKGVPNLTTRFPCHADANEHNTQENGCSAGKQNFEDDLGTVPFRNAISHSVRRNGQTGISEHSPLKIIPIQGFLLEKQNIWQVLSLIKRLDNSEHWRCAQENAMHEEKKADGELMMALCEVPTMTITSDLLA